MIINPYRFGGGGGGGGASSITFNPADKGANTGTSELDKRVTKTTGNAWESIRNTLSKSSGKWQVDLEVVDQGGGTQGVMIGICKASVSMSGLLAVDANGFGYYGDGTKYTSSAPTVYGSAYGTGNTVTVYWDADNGKLYFGRENVVQGGGDPVAGTGAAFTGLSGSFYVAASVYVGGASSVRCITRTSTLLTGFSDWA